MKIIAIGDIHGRKVWEEIVKESADRYVFIGDYFDTHGTETAHQQMVNFEKILDFKEANPTKVVLLIGNHDFHYLTVAGRDRYSGFQDHHWEMIRELLEPAIEHGYLQMAYEEDGVLYTHAGVTKTWYKGIDLGLAPAKNINRAFASVPELFRFTMGKNASPYGDDVTQSPIWVRPESLEEDAIGGYKQVVGHTQGEDIILQGNFAFIDALGTSGEFLEVDNGKFKIRKI